MSELRQPPHNKEAEKSVLGSIMLDPETLSKVADFLRAEDFYTAKHSEIFRAMLEIYERREAIDVVTLSAVLKEKEILKNIGGRTYLANLVNSVPSSANLIYYAKIVRNKAVLRQLIEAANKISNLGYEEKEELDKILDKAESSLFKVSQRYVSKDFVPINEVLTEAFERIDELHKGEGKFRGIPTGFYDLDNILSGFQKSDLIILAARPSMGKSSLALDMARQVAVMEKVPVAIFSLEMSKEQLVDRFLCAQAGISLWKMRTGKLSHAQDSDDFPKLGEAMAVLSEAPIYLDDSATLNVMELRTKARRLQKEHKIGFMVIDYLQLMEGRNQDNRVQEISDISRNLKAIARELNIPVLALSQLSRSVEQRTPQIPQLADLRESGCLAGATKIFNVQSGALTNMAEIVHKSEKIKLLSLDAYQTNKFCQQKLSHAFATGKKMVYKLQTATGREILATANHQFMSLAGWKRLDHFSPGDFTATARKILPPKRPVQIDQNRLILLAHLIGDGCYLPRRVLQYTNTEMKNLKIVAQAARKSFACKTRIKQERNWYQLYLTAPFKVARGKRNPIAKWLDQDLHILGQRAQDKILPDLIFNLSNQDLSLFIKHLWATDGSITQDKNSAVIIFFSAKNKALLLQLQHLLLRFEIQSFIKKFTNKNKNHWYALDISGRTNQLFFLKKIGSFNKSETFLKKIKQYLVKEANPNCDIIPKTVWNKIKTKLRQKNISQRQFHKMMNWSYSGTARYQYGLSRKHLAKIADCLKDQELKNLAHSDIYWDRIISIKSQGRQEVYDLTVPKQHNFLANDFIVHNSIEQDADAVMFIYREEYYKKETDRPHVADILIKKHRNGPTGSVELYFDQDQASFKNLEKREENSSQS